MRVEFISNHRKYIIGEVLDCSDAEGCDFESRGVAKVISRDPTPRTATKSTMHKPKKTDNPEE